MTKESTAWPEPPPPIEYSQYDFAPAAPIDQLDQLRAIMKTLTEEQWCEWARQLHPIGAPPMRLIDRPAVIAWLKTWMHRS